MTVRSLQFGDVVTAQFPEQSPQGREQEGYKTCHSGRVSRNLRSAAFPIDSRNSNDD